MGTYPELHLRRYSHFVYGLLHLQLIFPGMSVTSWGRSVARNKDKGGLPNSQHLNWTAVDVVWDQGAKPSLEDLQATATKVGLEVVRTAAYDHIELAPQGP